MSVSITLESIRGPVEVKIHRDGTLSGEDLLDVVEHDQLSMELGGKKSQLLEFLKEFEEDPASELLRYFIMPHHDLVYLAADLAEHVLPIFEARYKYDFRPRDAIKAARDFVDNALEPHVLKKHESDTRMAEIAATNAEYSAISPESKSEAESAAWAADAIALVVSAATRVDDAEEAMWSAAEASKSAVRAAAYHASWERLSSKWEAANEKEQSWQVRRFVDVMEAIQTGKDWPDLKDTK